MEKRHQLVLLILAAIILFSIGYKYALVKQDDSPGESELVSLQQDQGVDAQAEKQKAAQEIVVHVAGEVQKPGVYRLPPDSRVVDAINLAGPTEDSALDMINLAAPLEDGKQIIVMSSKDLQQQAAGRVQPTGAPIIGSPQGAAVNAGSSRGLININQAGLTELEELPGIGPALGQRIIDYRTQNGPFAAIEDITNVSGIGEKRFEQIKSKICVN